MEKLLLGIAFAGIAVLAHGQGTIAFGNGALTRITCRDLDGTVRNVTAADNLAIGVFYGPANTTACEALVQAPGFASIGTTAGVMVNAPSVFALPGTEPGQVVSLQIRAWNAAAGPEGWRTACRGETDIRQVILAPTAGPGTVIWQTVTGTNPNRFLPLTCGLFEGPCCVPEPSSFALGALGGLLLLLLRRKSTGK